MNKVKVHQTSNLEEGYESRIKLYEDVLQHQRDVYNVLLELSYNLRENGSKHDWSKIYYFNDFAEDVLERQTNNDFKNRRWYKLHTSLERHHINSSVPENVNLLDVLEMIVDCIVSGKTRSDDGVDFKFLELDETLLTEAYWNTVTLINDNVILKIR